MHKNSKFPKKIIGAKFGRETHRADLTFIFCQKYFL